MGLTNHKDIAKVYHMGASQEWRVMRRDAIFGLALVFTVSACGSENIELEIVEADCGTDVTQLDAGIDATDTVDAGQKECPYAEPFMTNELVGSCYWQWCIDGNYSLRAKPDGVPCVKSIGLPSSGSNWELSQCAHGTCGKF